MIETIKNISKTYKNNVKIISYQKTWQPYQGQRKKRTKMIDTNSEKHKQNIIRNTIRAKTAIHDIVACNTFQYFVTLTISPNSKIDRYNYEDCTKHISKWLNNHINKYILVPELHKDKAYHFHLLADIPKNKLKHHKGSVFNIKSYKYGFSTAIQIKQGSEARIANYVQKYITKDLISTVNSGNQRYWCSNNLNRPKVEYNVQIPSNAKITYTKPDAFDIYQTNSPDNLDK